ncbi:MAG: vacJ like lipofamily protein [Micavibrio sp.]|nr:vacJ like lipofamily protein [Micavibrio sp.]
MNVTHFKSIRLLALTAALLVGVTGSASAQNAAGEIEDPYIGFNKAVFSFNDAADQAVLRPVALGYRYVVPRGGRVGVRNVLHNLRAPVNLANNLLQGDLDGAGTTLTRTVINTIIGVGGIFDVAASEGIPYREEDFGQTLGVWGVDHGPYMIIPLLGPSSARDATGLLADSLMDPINWYLHNTDNDGWVVARFVTYSVSRREELLDALDDLRRNSFDYYAAMKSAYVQNRAAAVHNTNTAEYNVGAAGTDHP